MSESKSRRRNWRFCRRPAAGRHTDAEHRSRTLVATGLSPASPRFTGSDGLLYGAAPYAGYGIKIVEVGGRAYVTAAYGTAFPSIEVWQYGGQTGPTLVYHYNSTGHGPSELGIPIVLPLRP